jgi:hypothetical protein
MNTLEIKKENAQKAYNEGCSDVKKVLINLLGKETFIAANITDRIKTYEDACEALGTTSDDQYFEYRPDAVKGHEKTLLAYAKLLVIVKALNEGWVPDWKNSSQYKYYPWWDLSSGSGLSRIAVYYRDSCSAVGSRLCFKSRELAEYAAKQFKDIYTEFLIS